MENLPFIIPAFIFVIAVLVFIHELGHFSVAKFFGVRVETFSIGFGPRLIGFTRNGTDYRISAIPLGGYVKMLGENPEEMEPGEIAPDSLVAKPRWQRLLVFLAGPAANVLLAVLLPTILFMVSFEMPAYKIEPAKVGFVVPGSPAARAGIVPGDLILRYEDVRDPTWTQVEDLTLINPNAEIPVEIVRTGQSMELALRLEARREQAETLGVSGMLPLFPGDGALVGQVEDGYPAKQAGLQPGDKIVEIEGARISHFHEVVTVVGANAGKPLHFKVMRGDQLLSLEMTPRDDGGVGRIGFRPRDVPDPRMIQGRLAPSQALRESLRQSERNLWLLQEAVSQIFRGERKVRDTFAGPVAMAQMSGKVAQQGILPLLEMMAMFSMGLGVFNLLPIPVLDGGHVFMLLLESVFGLAGRKVSLKLRERIQTAGLAAIMLFMGYIIYSDVIKLVQRSDMRPPVVQEPAQR